MPGHAHSRGLLHRDLKPANILIAGDGTPMLLDFNLSAPTEIATEACPQGQSGEPVVHRALLGGTLPYMAPEHLDAIDPEGSTSPDAVEERSDIYALGLILFEMISGNHPFPEPPAGLTPVATIRGMKADRRRLPASSLRACCPEVPWSLDALVSQCLDPEPDRRYQTAQSGRGSAAIPGKPADEALSRTERARTTGQVGQATSRPLWLYLHRLGRAGAAGTHDRLHRAGLRRHAP